MSDKSNNENRIIARLGSMRRQTARKLNHLTVQEALPELFL
jgi:hypothetical protein